MVMALPAPVAYPPGIDCGADAAGWVSFCEACSINVVCMINSARATCSELVGLMVRERSSSGAEFVDVMRTRSATCSAYQVGVQLTTLISVL